MRLDEESQIREQWCMVTSAIFLLFTAYRYCIRGFYRTLFGKSVINLCVSLAMGLVIFESMRYMSTDQRAGCIVRGSVAYYLILVSFFWMNAICIQTVTANEIVAARLESLTPEIIDLIIHSVIPERHYENPIKRRYHSYLIYAWGTPAVFCVFIMPFVSIVFGETVCKYLVSDEVQWVFIYSCMLVLTAINIYLFAIDADIFNEPSKLLSICNGENESESGMFSGEEQEPRSGPQVFNMWRGGLEQVYACWRRMSPMLLHLFSKANRYLKYRIVNCIRFRLFVVMTVSWLSNMLISLMPANNGTLDVIAVMNNLRGIWIFIVLVVFRIEEPVEDEDNTVYKNNIISEETEYLQVQNRVTECFRYEDV
ncbi:hypothetical protein O0L34_g1633 [Tuta absoluta]|nr:hypothetical protein O0L34_g1633 [Tuta absoluta]